MGAYSPVPMAGKDVVDEVLERAVRPTLAALQARGIDYRGVLYAGIMLTSQGPKVLEYNVRFGDPEAQVVLPRYAGNLAELLEEAASGRLESEPQFDDRAAVTVVLAAEGYPLHPRTGDVIEGLEVADALDDVLVFRAGVALDSAGRCVTAGGRVLAVTGQGDDLAAARATAYDAVSRISWPGMQYRTDIAAGAVRHGRNP